MEHGSPRPGAVQILVNTLLGLQLRAAATKFLQRAALEDLRSLADVQQPLERSICHVVVSSIWLYGIPDPLGQSND